MEKLAQNRRSIVTILIVVICLIAIAFISYFALEKTKVNAVNASEFEVATHVQETDFIEFYYTYSTTTNPPDFQRYRIFKEGEKFFFYHEKREGSNIPLTESEITVYGTKELASEEWGTFWSYISKGSISKRSEVPTTGDSGPWLYLYLEGEFNEYQEFHFIKPGTILSFEKFLSSLKFSELYE